MKNLILLAVLFFVAAAGKSQIVHTDHSLQDTYLNKLALDGKSTVSYDEIDGSPYLSPDFVSGFLYAPDGDEYAKTMIRFNIYDDQMEFKSPDGRTMALNKTNDYTIVLNDRKFRYFPQNGLKSYCEIVSEGKLMLLKKYNVKYQKPEAPKAYEQSAPARFISGKEKYFLLSNNGDVQFIANTKKIVQQLGDFESQAKKYVSENKLKLNSEEGIKQLIDYYNANH